MKPMLVVWLLLAASGPAPGQTPPALPEWRLNVAKSTFDPGPPPRSTTTTRFTDGRTATFTTVGTDERGRKIHDVTVFERQ